VLTKRATVLVAALVGALALWLASASGAPGAATPQQILALLNAQRAHNGIPAGIVEDPSWTADCRQHNRYEQVNDILTHTENAGAPGYTSTGELAGANSVIDVAAPWGSSDPYDDAPFHLFQLLAPALAVAGAADSNGRDCVTTLLGDTRASPTQVIAYSYPGNDLTGVAPSEHADELPTTPAQQLGLGSAATGPNLFVYFTGPWAPGAAAHLSTAVVTGPHGEVAPALVLDNTTPGPLPGSYPTGAIIVPVAPLLKDTLYRVAVTATVTGIEPTGAVSGAQCETLGTQPQVCGTPRIWPVTEDFAFTTGTG
jgi:hypothetical protein